MPNETTPENENKDLQEEGLEDENINIDDIEGLEKDISEEAPAEEKKEVLYDDGPKLSDKLKEIEDSIVKEEPKELPISNKEELEYIESHAEIPSHDDEHDDVEILEHEHDDDEDDEEEKEGLLSKLKDKKNLLKLLIAILVILVLIITSLFIFLPSDSKENTEPQAVQKTEEPVEEMVVPTTPQSTYRFKLDHINITRVNNKLEKLTKYELLGMTEEEYLRQERLKAEKKAKEEAELKERLRLEQEEKARIAKEEAALQEKLRLEQEEKERLAKELAEQEALKAQSENTNINEEVKKENSSEKNSEQMPTEDESAIAMNSNNMFLKFVHVPTYKKVLYKTELAKIKDIGAQINPCRNTKNFIEIFVGPLKDESQYDSIVDALNQKANYKNIKMLELTQEEFEKRCMVY